MEFLEEIIEYVCVKHIPALMAQYFSCVVYFMVWVLQPVGI